MVLRHNPARRRLSTALNRTVPVVAGLGAVAWLAPAPVGTPAGWLMVATLILIPIGRVAWLSARWLGFDRRYGLAGCGLLAAVAVAAVTAFLLR